VVVSSVQNLKLSMLRGWEMRNAERVGVTWMSYEDIQKQGMPSR